MKISTSSLHYRITNFFWGFRFWDWKEPIMPRSLCLYFWTMVFSPLIPVISLAVVSLAGSLIYMIVVGIGIMGVWDLYHSEDVGFIFIGFQLLIWALSAAGIYAEYRKHKSPSILIQYIKAKKEKVCPIIEYTK